MCEDCRTLGLSRRAFLGGAAALAAATVPLAAIWSTSVSAQDAVSPDEAIKRLQDGNDRYVAGTSINRDYSVGRAERAQGQRPFASIVSCADSRVAPEIIYDQGPGELFVVRVAGNFVSEYGLASLEYGALVLGSQLVMVLGHSGCGAVNSAIRAVKDGTVFPGHLPGLMDQIKPAVEVAIAEKPADLLAAATVANVRQNVEYLRTATPVFADLVAAGKVNVVGAVYDIATGKITPV